MKNLVFLTLLLILLAFNFSPAQPVIYNDNISLITGTWHSNGNLVHTNLDIPAEGNYHYRFTYNFNEWWSGFGLNMDNWGGSSGKNFSPYTYLSISYKGISGAEFLQVRLRNGSTQSNDVFIGYASVGYRTIIIPLNSFSGINLNNITEMIFSVTGVQSASGQVFIDDIKLTDTGHPPYAGQNANHTSGQTWLRHARMNKGLNLSNWLEAYWLIPFNAFPESNKYNRTNVRQLVDMGFKNIRMPVTFERVAASSYPYTIPANHQIWQLIDSVVVWAEEMDFTLIICNHHGFEITNTNYSSEVVRKQTIWQQVLSRYGALDPDRYFFELFNEPANEINNINLRQFYINLLSTVRPIIPNHTLIIGGNNWNSKSGLTGIDKLQDPDIIYTYHDYDPWTFTHAGMSWTTPSYMPVLTFPRAGFPNDINDLINSVASVKMWADTSGVPVMLGEFGVSTGALAADRCRWVQTISLACQNNSIPWYYWDAVTNNDAFGFISLLNGNIVECFADTLSLGSYNICPKIVTTVSDYGVGSLRNALMCATDGDVITFHPSIAGDTIFLSTYSVGLTKNVILRNTNEEPIVIVPMYDYPNIQVLSGVHAELDRINLKINVSDALRGSGQLTLRDLQINTGNLTLISDGEGILYIEGNVLIKQ